jgi:hypothetical protein
VTGHARTALDPGYVAEVLGRIAEREVWQRRELAAYRAGLRRGWRDGWRAGYEAADSDWYIALAPARRAAARAARIPTHAELEVRRWGPGGREHFGDPRPGDFKGRAR